MRTFLRSTLALLFLSPAAHAQSFASIVGWEGDKDAAITAPDGSFYVRDGINQTVSFGIYPPGTPLDWASCEGWLPCMATTFDAAKLHVTITSFGDKVAIGSDVVIVYTRVAVRNDDTAAATADPKPSATPGLVALASPSVQLAPGATANFDFAIVIDRFGQNVARPMDPDVMAAGSWDAHYAHMKQYWSDRVSKIVDIRTLPEPRLITAYKAGFAYTHIVKDGLDLHVGENGYDQVFDHDLVGILSSLFVLGDFQDAHALLGTMSKYIYAGSQYADASWKFSWPFATYLQKTGDLDFIKASFDAVRTRTRTISSDRTGPGGIMGPSNDIDANGYWTSDDWAALLGLTTYRWLATAAGQDAEAQWASDEYNALFSAIDGQIASLGLGYIPCSAMQPNEMNRCKIATDANWMALSILGSWAWDGYLWGASQDGTMLSLLDATYDYGFARIGARLPPHTYGGYPGFSSAYNAGYGISGLRGQTYRSEAILDYIFMLDRGQSGPYAWWEDQLTPAPADWRGTHPSNGGGSCPHMWGQSFAFRALLDSLIVEKGDGTMIVGRGVPAEWLGQPIEVANVPFAMGKRMGFAIGGTDTDVTLALSGDAPAKDVLFDLPAFAGRACTASAGEVHRDEGYVTIPAGTTRVIVHLDDVCAPPPPPMMPPNPTTPANASSCGCDTTRTPTSATGMTLAALLLFVRRLRKYGV